MNIIKTWIKRIPFVEEVYFKVTTQRSMKQLSSRVLEKKEIQIKEALISLQRELPQSDRYWKDRIEVERDRLLRRNEALSDGSLGEAGLYDNGRSIKDACLVSKPAKPAILLFLLTRAIKPLNVIELGTNVGISSAYIGAGLKANGQNGRLTTLDA